MDRILRLNQRMEAGQWRKACKGRGQLTAGGGINVKAGSILLYRATHLKKAHCIFSKHLFFKNIRAHS